MEKPSDRNVPPRESLLALFDMYFLLACTFESTHHDLNTLRTYIVDFVESTYQQKDVFYDELPQSFLHDFHDFLLDEKQLPFKTVAKNVGKIIEVFYTSELTGAIEDDEDDKFTNYRHADVENTVLTLSITEINTFESMIIDCPEKDIIRDLFVFSCYTGLTLGELKSVTTEDLIIKDCSPWLHVRRKNEDRSRCVPIFEEATRVMKKYSKIRRRKQSTKIFPVRFPDSTFKVLNELAKQVGVEEEIDFSTGRFTFATTVALTKHLPSSIADEVYGSSRIHNNNEYQDILFFEYLYEQERLKKNQAKN